MHVTSGTTGEPVAVGFTQRDHEANSAVGGEAFRIAGLRPDDVVAHCLNYALYAGGIADHMALEASGATVVPVGTGQSRRLLELIPQLGITAIFGTLSFPAYLAARAREARRGAARARACATSSPRASPAPGSRRCAPRSRRPGARRVADSFGMSDVWSTMGGRVRGGRGAAPHRRRARRARAGRPGQRRRRWSSRTARAASSSGRTCAARPRRCCATAPATSARVWTSPCACGRTLAADPHRRPPRRHAARAGRERLPAGDRRRSWPTSRSWAATAWSPRATRSSRRCACTWRRRRTSTSAASTERAPRRAARPLRGHAARARVAARGRAQDPHRPPDGARGRAAGRSRGPQEGDRHDDRHAPPTSAPPA